jgi:hypothetical protein
MVEYESRIFAINRNKYIKNRKKLSKKLHNSDIIHKIFKTLNRFMNVIYDIFANI